MAVGYIILVLLLMATVGVMIAGVVLMGIGGETNKRYSHKLMAARVWLQGLSLMALALLFMVGKS